MIASMQSLQSFRAADFITRPGSKSAKVTIKDLDIIACDARHYPEQPQKDGVNVWQGALTVYNFDSDADSRIDLSIDNVSIGRKYTPVLGSGLFVSGFGDKGGQVVGDTYLLVYWTMLNEVMKEW